MTDNINPPSRWKQFRYRLEAGVVRLLACLVPRLPQRTVATLGRVIGWLGYYLLPRQRRIARANLDVAYGATMSAAEKRRIARTSFKHFAGTMLGLCWAPRLTAANFTRFIETEPEGLQKVRELQKSGRRIIFVTLHYGNWEWLGLATCLHGFRMTVVARQMTNPVLEEIFARLRAATGNRMIRQRSALPKLFKALHRGEPIALLIDLNAPRRGGGVWVDFFGLPVFNNSAAAGLALRTGAAIVFGRAEPTDDGRLRISYGPIIDPVVSGDAAADRRVLSQRCLTECETIIRRKPDYWLWSYKRWKHYPPGLNDRYPFYSRPAPPDLLREML